MAEGYNIYRDAGSGAVDYSTPIGHAAPGATQAIVSGLSLSPGRCYCFALRAESAAGVEEKNTHVRTFVRVDEQGGLLPSPLPRPADLCAEVAAEGQVMLAFSCPPRPPYDQPASFEVFTDNGTGKMDLQNPVATLGDFAPGQGEFEALLALPALPARLAVRGKKDAQAGPLSAPVAVPVSAAPTAVRTL